MKKFGFATIVFAVLVFAVFPSSSQSSPTEELEGTLEIMVATNLQKKECKTLYSIKVDKERIPFDLPTHPPPNLSSGQKVKITGRWNESGGEKSFKSRKIETFTSTRKSAVKKSADSSEDDISSYLPEQNIVSGEIKVLVVCVNSPDTKESSPEWSKETLEDKISSNKHSLEAYWKACFMDNETGESKIWFSVTILEGWREMPKELSEYGYGSDEERKHTKEFREDMISLLDPEIDFTQYDGLIVFRAGKNWAYDWASLGKQLTETNDGEIEISASFLNENDITVDNDYSAHETGHGLFSLIHAHSKSLSNETVHDYGDWWENRGKQYALLDGIHKYELGGLSAKQIKMITSSGSFWLDQRELASGGTKLLIINLGFDRYKRPILFYLEYHRGLGEFDSQLHFENKNEAVDPQNLVLLRKYEVNLDYASVVYLPDDDGNNCLDLESEEFQDSESGITFQVLQKTGEGVASKAEVEITLPSSYTVPTAPTPEPTPTPVLSYDMGFYSSLGGGDGSVFHKGDKPKMEVNVTGANEEALQADEITCQMTRSDGSFKLKTKTDTSKGVFIFLIRKKHPPGDYKMSVKISKEGYVDVEFEVDFTVED